jgi:nucleotide-binding universal stress UspA family protein
MSAAILLVPVDGSPACDTAIRMLCGWHGDGAAIAPVVLNVQHWPLSLWPHPMPDSGAVEMALLDEGARIAKAAGSQLSSAGLTAQVEVRLGIAAPAILEEARTRGATAIVMGTRAGRGLSVLGSVATRVAHGSTLPTILVKPGARLPAGFGRRARVLVPVDGSAHANRAAVTLAQWRGWLGEAVVDLVHVQQPLTILETLLPPHRDALEQWGGSAAGHAAKDAGAALDAAGIQHHVHFAVGEPPSRIAQLAADLGSDFVMMGTRGLGATHHALIGSVALKTLEQAAVPVVLVP